jgi:hypothetical protein
VDIEVKLALEVVRSKFTKATFCQSKYSIVRQANLLGFIPSDNGRETNLVHAREESEEGEDQRSPDELVLVEERDNVEGLIVCQSAVPHPRWSKLAESLNAAVAETEHTFSLDFSFIGACAVTGAAFDCEATFLLRSSSACASTPVVRAAVAIVVGSV